MVRSFVEGAFFICSNIAFSLLLTYAASKPIIGLSMSKCTLSLKMTFTGLGFS